jgi:hypothetical protein
VKIFGWSSFHQKIITADNLSLRGIQHKPNCPLYDAEPEDAKHLLINCAFTKEVYRFIWLWFGLRGIALPCFPRQGPAKWLEINASRASVGNVRKAADILLYCWWNVWKEKQRETKSV